MPVIEGKLFYPDKYRREKTSTSSSSSSSWYFLLLVIFAPYKSRNNDGNFNLNCFYLTIFKVHVTSWIDFRFVLSLIRSIFIPSVIFHATCSKLVRRSFWVHPLAPGSLLACANWHGESRGRQTVHLKVSESRMRAISLLWHNKYK